MKKILFTAALAISAVIVSSACKNPPIFAAIEQEVKLNPASVAGFIHGIVQVGDTLYASNGKIYEKSVGSTEKWSKKSDCPSGLCTMIATDGTNLYASFGQDGSFTVRKYDPAASTWTALPASANNAQYVIGTDTVFAFNQTSNGYTFYTIKNSAIIHTWSNTQFPSGAVRTYCLLEDGLYSETGTKITGSPTSGLKGICAGSANSVFVFDNSTLYCYDGSKWTDIEHGVSSPQSITYLPSKQLVLIGGIKGYGEIKLAGFNNDLIAAQLIQAGAEYSSVPSANIHQYNNSVGKYTIKSIKAFDYGANAYIIYAGINDSNTKYTGLWGFYYPNRIEWNRE